MVSTMEDSDCSAQVTRSVRLMVGPDQRLDGDRRQVVVSLVQVDEADQQVVSQGDDSGVAAVAVGDQQEAPIQAEGVQDRPVQHTVLDNHGVVPHPSPEGAACTAARTVG
jgi:hypothetical protein